MIRTQEADGCLAITLARPDKANALTATMLEQIAKTVEASAANVLILTGEGKVFSAGADLEAVETQGLALSPAWERASSAIAGFEGLSVAALNGTVAGGAMGMVLACDLRVCVDSAQFFYPVVKMGVLPQPSDPARLSALVGPARAKLILLGGAKISAQDALAFGLVDRICTPDTLRDEVAEVIAPAHRAPPEQIRAIKDLIRKPL